MFIESTKIFSLLILIGNCFMPNSVMANAQLDFGKFGSTNTKNNKSTSYLQPIIDEQDKLIILVDVLVGTDGQALKTIISPPARYTSFNRLALRKAMKQTYPLKIDRQGIPIEYWLKKQSIYFQIQPQRNTHIKH